MDLQGRSMNPSFPRSAGVGGVTRANKVVLLAKLPNQAISIDGRIVIAAIIVLLGFFFGSAQNMAEPIQILRRLIRQRITRSSDRSITPRMPSISGWVHR